MNILPCLDGTDHAVANARLMTLAAIAGVTSAMNDGATPDDVGARLAIVPFGVYGDAIRLGLEAPQTLRRWCGQATLSLLGGVLLEAAICIDRRVPGIHDESLATTLVMRDHVESVLLGVKRVWLPNPVVAIEGYTELVDQLADIDRKFGVNITFEQVGRILGSRSGFGASWAKSFRAGEWR